MKYNQYRLEFLGSVEYLRSVEYTDRPLTNPSEGDNVVVVNMNNPSQKYLQQKYQYKGNLPSSKVIRRRGGAPRDHAVFIDGTALDRASRRLNKKIDLSALLRGVCGGIDPRIARYYTIIPYEDDSRHHSFLDAVRNAGLEVILKRLPPKGINRQVAVDFDMAVDIMAFGLGHIDFQVKRENEANIPISDDLTAATSTARDDDKSSCSNTLVKAQQYSADKTEINNFCDSSKIQTAQKIVTVVCPSRELARPIELLNKMNVDTVSVDFGQFNPGDVLKSAAKWIDLSNADTIWLAMD
jgi:hypothetical protein